MALQAVVPLVLTVFIPAPTQATHHWQPACVFHTNTLPLLSVTASLLPSAEKQQVKGWDSTAAVRLISSTPASTFQMDT